MRRILLILPLLVLLFSCSKVEEENEYANWEERNAHYIDSIATLAQTGADGWKRLLAYNVPAGYAEANPEDKNVYVYMKELKASTGTAADTISPIFTDSVRVYYKGRLIPQKSYPQGQVFDNCFKGDEPNDETDVPKLFGVNNVVVGFATALQSLHVGEFYRIVIPQLLGYGSTAKSSIPAYSTLIFDVKLKRIYKSGEDTSWQ